MKQISEACPGSYVVLDQASWHKSQVVKKKFKALGITPVFNPSYSPELNLPVEASFKLIKDHYKRLLLDELLLKMKVPRTWRVEKAVSMVQTVTI